MSDPQDDRDLDQEIGELLNERPVEPDESLFQRVVVLDGLPVVTEDKASRLVRFLEKFGKKHGAPIPNADNINLFLSPNAKGVPEGHGFAFLTYATAEQANLALEKLDGINMDKKTKLTAKLYSDFQRIMHTPDQFEELQRDPDLEQFTAELRANLDKWSADPRPHDQLLVRYPNEGLMDLEVAWNDPIGNPDGRQTVFLQSVDNEGMEDRPQLWAENMVVWSPQGRMLASLHPQGVALWGGAGFHLLARLSHPEPFHVMFSPREGYIVSFNHSKGSDDTNASGPATKVWNIFRGTEVTRFGPMGSPGELGWSHDEQYLTRVLPEGIKLFRINSDSVEELPGVQVPGVSQAIWSPDQNVLAYAVPEVENAPAKIVLLAMPSGQVLRERHLYGVAQMGMQWHQRGDFLGVKMVRHKKGKNTSTQVEVFRLREKDVPVESLEFSEVVHWLDWEPNGRRLAVITGDVAPRSLQLYTVQQRKIKQSKKFETLGVSGRWAPHGGYLALIRQDQTRFDFFDATNEEFVNEGGHLLMNGLEWSSDGQYLLTSCCAPDGALDIESTKEWILKSEAGYKIWSKLGEKLYECKIERLQQIMWRPRPPSPLTSKEIGQLKSKLREKYWKQFEAEDDRLRFQLLGDEAKERQLVREQWRSFRQECADILARERAIRQERFGEDLEEHHQTVVVELVEEEQLDSRTEVYSR